MSADGTPAGGAVDHLCNAFTPDREAVWRRAIEGSGVPVKVREGAEGFAEPEAFVARLDEAGVATVVLPALDPAPGAAHHPTAYDHVASRWDEVEALAGRWPGRFAALAVVDPTAGWAGVAAARRRLELPWVVGLHLHTHSWDRRFDHADLYPWYAAAADADVPVVVQAGTSGGLDPSGCGHPIGIDRPALYFPQVRFVLSHLGWPWCDEAIAMALKFPNVWLGTGAYPPRHWPPSVVSFARGPGRAKVMAATNFPTVGHLQLRDQLAELDLPEATRDALAGGTARAVFTRLT